MLSKKDAIQLIKGTIIQTFGCTDPVAIAYAARRARETIDGELLSIRVVLNRNIYKNSKDVFIPGTKEKGISFAVCLAMVLIHPGNKLLIFQNVTEKDILKAKELEKKNIVEVECDPSKQELYIEVKIITPKESASVCIERFHDHIAKIEKNGKTIFLDPPEAAILKKEIPLTDISLKDFMNVIHALSEEEVAFLAPYIDINVASSEIGLQENTGIALGSTLKKLQEQGILADDRIYRIKYMAAASIDARMGGKKVPIIGCGGSGNAGITFFVTVGMAYRLFPEMVKLSLAKSLAFGLLVLVAIKSQTGVLTPMCGCAVAAASAAAAALLFGFGGNEKQILSGIHMVLAAVSGLVCDGAKGMCACKIASSVQVALEAVFFSLYAPLERGEGFLGKTLEESLRNLKLFHKEGLANVDKVILDILLQKS